MLLRLYHSLFKKISTEKEIKKLSINEEMQLLIRVSVFVQEVEA